MSRFVTDYVLALAVCGAVALGYRFGIVPMLEPPSIAVVEMNAGAQEQAGPNFQGLFPPGSWQLDNPKVLEASWGTLLFKRWERDSPDRWHVAPVTVVLRRESDDSSREDGGGNENRGEDPIILDAPEGAIVEFAEPMNMITGATPSIQGGQLIGEVSIHNLARSHQGLLASQEWGPGVEHGASLHGDTDVTEEHQLGSSQDDSQEAFRLVTRNVRIDSRQIRSSEEVSLQIAGAILRGRDLTIHLAGGGTIAPARSTPLSVLDSLELIYLDELRVPLPDGPLWEPISKASGPRLRPSPLPATEASRRSPVPAEFNVQCDGRVVFDFATFTLSLLEGVRLEHHWGPGKMDSFRCRTLDLHLVDPFVRKDLEHDTVGVRDKSGESAEELTGVLRRIVARGAPVQATLPSLQGQLQAEEVVLETATGTLRVEGGFQSAIIEYHGIRWEGERFEYQMDLQDPSRLGTLECPGRGEIVSELPTVKLRKFRWDKALKLIKKDGFHQLWLEGDIHLQTLDGGEAKAGGLFVEFDARGLGGPDPLLLKRIWAQDKVHVDFPTFAADTEQMFVLVDHLPASMVVADPIDEDAPEGPRLEAATGRRERQWLSGPTEDLQKAKTSQFVAPVARPRPRLQGREFNALLTIRGDELIASDISLQQDVRLNHDLNTSNGPLPLEYTGKALRFVRNGNDDQLQISGSPARIVLGDGFFEGPLVVVDGRLNQVMIDSYGVFQMPSNLVPQGNAAITKWTVPPRCDFRGRLVFDGKVVEIGDEVRIAGRVATGAGGEQWDMIAWTPQVQIVLDRSIEVVRPETARQATVELVSLLGQGRDVEVVANQLSAKGDLLARHVLHTPRIDFLVPAAQLRGEGPGWYRSWAPASPAGPLRSLASPGSIAAIHLIYSGGIEGLLASQQLDFYHGVRVGMGVVPNWDTSPDAAAMSQLQMNQGTVDCDRLRISRVPSVAQTPLVPSGRMPWELQSLGSVAFRLLSDRGMVSGTANRLAYDSSKDRFLLDGTPAVIQHRDLNNQPVFNASLPFLSLNAKTLAIEAQVQEATLSGVQELSRQ